MKQILLLFLAIAAILVFRYVSLKPKATDDYYQTATHENYRWNVYIMEYIQIPAEGVRIKLQMNKLTPLQAYDSLKALIDKATTPYYDKTNFVK